MPSSWIHINIKINDKPVSWVTEQFMSKALPGNEGRVPARRAFDALWNMLAGDVQFFVHTTDDSGAYATGAIGVTQANAAGDTITFTWKGRTVVLTEGGTGYGGFSRGASNADLATNLAATINRHPVLGGLVRATAGAASVTLTAKVTGTLPGKLVISTSDATAFALTQLTGGTDSLAGTFLQAIWTGRR